VILGPVGDNFGAGMTGGMAYVYDPDNTFETRMNSETLICQSLKSAYWESALIYLIEQHAAETGSPLASELLRNWERTQRHFKQICPKEMLNRLPHPLNDDQEQETA